MTLPRPCQGRPPAALSGRSSQVFGRVLGAVKLELLGLSLPPWTDPLVGGSYSAWPKASSSPSTHREVTRGEAGGFTWQQWPLRIWHPGLVSRPAKAEIPRDLGRKVRQHPPCPSSPRPVAPSGGGFVVHGRQLYRHYEFRSNKHRGAGRLLLACSRSSVAHQLHESADYRTEVTV